MTFMFEHYSQPLVPRSVFLRRLGRFAAAAFLLVIVSWIIGILGYHALEGLSWIDSVLNAAMILGGMGPVDTLHTNAGKLFASFYALFSGLVFLISASILIAPLFHRLLHQFHLETPKDDDDADDSNESP